MKRLIDFFAAAAGILCLWPVLLVVAFLVRRKLGSPVVFSQIRPGLGGKPFRMYKFRTMTDARDEHGQLLPDEVRLTAFGRF
ncbi:MAG: sugar transferase, partial [Burkholderiaceae bacterium]